MKRVCKIGKFAVGLFLALAASGCINVEYVGQSFPVLPEDDPVAFYSRKSPVKDKKYQVIGRVLLTAPPSVSQSDILTKLGKVAREHGANAVNVVEYKQVLIGSSRTEEDALFAPDYNLAGHSSAGEVEWLEKLGKPATLSQPSTYAEISVKALLMISGDRYEKLKKIADNVGKEQTAEKNTPAESVEDAAGKAIKRQRLEPSEVKVPAGRKESKPLEIDLTDDRTKPVKL